MPYAEVTDPIRGPAAFGETGGEAAQAQAAVLLLLGAQLRGEDRAVRRGVSLRPAARAELSDPDAPDEFPVPRVPPARRRLDPGDVRARLARRHGLEPRAAAPGAAALEAAPGRLAAIAEDLYAHPSQLNAALLLEASLAHPDPLTRVAAAASYFELSAEPGRPLEVLVEGTRSDERLVREVAATALARIAPDHPRLRELLPGGPGSGPGVPARTSLLIHGTFARDDAWWQPGGDFHGYILTEVRRDLYNAPDRFSWSGGYSDAARALGGADLRDWAAAHGATRPDLFGHSHGGSVAIVASQVGLEIDELVLLSVPVHVPKYLPDFGRIRKVVSIRVRFDLVILADFGGQRYRDPRIAEHVLPIWFDHGAVLKPQVWRDHNVPAKL